ncbi:MAG: SPOR domain-containing protein [Tepidimonas sp.]|uniref:SPOR domain-containing protein n=1 Tax=Tepidimonas sp. TaxID=2002775 RepID=UPI00259FA684|nr:SPOR domain-containing protein [Tepidimonas sp.]MDM7456042.1 SPOR domain-containing protein [Tepidimonas sp.]
MLRVLVIVLLVANGALWAWQRGWLGLTDAPRAADAAREPQRLAQQVAPERLRLLNAPGGAAIHSAALTESTPAGIAQAAPSTDSAAPDPLPDRPAPPAPVEPRRCWQLAALTPAQADAVRRSADGEAGLRGRRTETAAVLPERWIVYLGKFPSADALQRRRAELRQAGIDQREVNTPALTPGLALGTYSSEAAARNALQDLVRQGVRDARVVQERPETRTITLRWPDLTEAEHGRLQAALDGMGRALQACP